MNGMTYLVITNTKSFVVDEAFPRIDDNGRLVFELEDGELVAAFKDWRYLAPINAENQKHLP